MVSKFNYEAEEEYLKKKQRPDSMYDERGFLKLRVITDKSKEELEREEKER